MAERHNFHRSSKGPGQPYGSSGNSNSRNNNYTSYSRPSDSSYSRNGDREINERYFERSRSLPMVHPYYTPYHEEWLNSAPGMPPMPFYPIPPLPRSNSPNNYYYPAEIPNTPYYEHYYPNYDHPQVRGRSNEPISSSKDRNHEATLLKERPCRTLFVRNVHFDITEDQIRNIFEKYGDIKGIYNLLGKRGLAFITFYDLRAAEKAKREMQEFDLNGRKIDIHFSLPKEDMNQEEDKCDRTKNQGTLLLTVKNPSQNITSDEIQTLFSQFGDVKCVRDFKTHVNQKFVEFYDSRACVSSYDQLLNTQFKNGTIDLRFVWDYPARLRKFSSAPATVDRRGSDHYEPHYSEPAPPMRKNEEKERRKEPILAAKKVKVDDEEEDYRLVQAQKAQQMLALAASAIPQAGIVKDSNDQTISNTTNSNSGNNILNQMNQLLSLLQQKKAD